MNRRPRLTLHAPSASDAQAAAIVAALERFMRDHAPAPRGRGREPDGWLRAALAEGVEREPGFDGRDPWLAP
ncbi:MAG TPA: hypothetical protein VMA83_06245 [Solirubrobacteraceae bacterium]|nr:hypothetical protein [Solirubrobacteraceae bacterium]